MAKTSEQGISRLEIGIGGGQDIGGNYDSNDETIDANDTRHNYRNQSFHHLARIVDTHASNANAALACAIRSSNAGENDGQCGARIS